MQYVCEIQWLVVRFLFVNLPTNLFFHWCRCLFLCLIFFNLLQFSFPCKSSVLHFVQRRLDGILVCRIMYAFLNPFASVYVYIRTRVLDVEKRSVDKKYWTLFIFETWFRKPLTSPIQRATRDYVNRLMRKYFLSPRLILPGFGRYLPLPKAVYPL